MTSLGGGAPFAERIRAGAPDWSVGAGDESGGLDRWHQLRAREHPGEALSGDRAQGRSFSPLRPAHRQTRPVRARDEGHGRADIRTRAVVRADDTGGSIRVPDRARLRNAFARTERDGPAGRAREHREGFRDADGRPRDSYSRRASDGWSRAPQIDLVG